MLLEGGGENRHKIILLCCSDHRLHSWFYPCWHSLFFKINEIAGPLLSFGDLWRLSSSSLVKFKAFLLRRRFQTDEWSGLSCKEATKVQFLVSFLRPRLLKQPFALISLHSYLSDSLLAFRQKASDEDQSSALLGADTWFLQHFLSLARRSLWRLSSPPSPLLSRSWVGWSSSPFPAWSERFCFLLRWCNSRPVSSVSGFPLVVWCSRCITDWYLLLPF